MASGLIDLCAILGINISFITVAHVNLQYECWSHFMWWFMWLCTQGKTKLKLLDKPLWEVIILITKINQLILCQKFNINLRMMIRMPDIASRNSWSTYNSANSAITPWLMMPVIGNNNGNNHIVNKGLILIQVWKFQYHILWYAWNSNKIHDLLEIITCT